MNRVSVAVGQVLRSARLRAGLTLGDVLARSRGKFKPSSVGGYERGERSITVERLAGLAALYGIPPDQLLTQAMQQASPETRRELSVRVSRLPLVSDDIGRRVAELVHHIKAQRGDFMTDVITLRSGDLEALAHASETPPGAILTSLAPAVVRSSASG